MFFKIIAVDFDGTLVENKWPFVGRINRKMFDYCLEQQKQGAKLVLWTCREGSHLDDAVAFCRNNGLEFDAVNDNIPEQTAQFGSNPRKVYAHEYIDDRCANPCSNVPYTPAITKDDILNDDVVYLSNDGVDTPHFLTGVLQAHENPAWLTVSHNYADLFAKSGFQLYAVQEDNTLQPVVAKDAATLAANRQHLVLLSNEWVRSDWYHQLIRQRLAHQPQRLARFQSCSKDAFAIFQLKEDTDPRLRFCDYDTALKYNQSITMHDYDLVYTGILADIASYSQNGAEMRLGVILEKLFMTFNLNHPTDYHRPSMSMSDVVALRIDGQTKYYYCDTVGFRELRQF